MSRLMTNNERVRFDSSPRSYTSLLNRGQFILGPPVDVADWRTMPLENGTRLAFHPDLSVTRVTGTGITLTLAGFMLDPLFPERTDEEILRGLVRGCAGIDELIVRTARFGGRWALIASDGERRIVLNDAIGLRQVFYAPDERSGACWAASQPKLLADLLGLAISEPAARFMDSYAFRRQHEGWWPGDTTPYREVRHLLPNHCLDLASGRAVRWWPKGPLPRLAVDEAAGRVAVMLRGLLRAAAHRFELAIPVTAGLDSRVVLAASRDVRDRAVYFTLRQARMADDSADLAIPPRLLARLGLEHEIVRAAASTSAEFSGFFKRHVFLAHDHYGPDAEAIFEHYALRRVVVTGSGAEIGRSDFLERIRPRQPLSAGYLAYIRGFGGNGFVIEANRAWLKGLGPLHGVSAIELFEWEQEHGNWLAMTQLEFDTAWREIIAAYNCREILTSLLAVHERHRRAPRYTLFRRIVERLWPEVLSEPVNPHKAGRLPALRRCLARWRTACRLYASDARTPSAGAGGS